MTVSVELSYYPLKESYGPAVSELIARLRNRPNLKTESGSMSTLLYGEYEAVFAALREEILHFMELYPSVFLVKLSNCCPV